MHLGKAFIKRAIIIIIIAFDAFCVTNIFLQFSQYNNLDTIPVTFQAIFIMSLCVVYFFQQIRNPNTLFIYSTFEFWIVTGILIYLAGTFFIYIFSSNLTSEELDQYWSINYIFNTIKNILFALGLFVLGRKSKKPVEKDPFNYFSALENP
jgi:hypothetical protein